MRSLNKVLLAVGLSVSVLLVTNLSNMTCCSRTVSYTNDLPQSFIEECVAWSSSQSWYAWVSGNSRSAQFHFVDLLELLYRSHKSSTEFSQ